jgi:hypothetical protein
MNERNITSKLRAIRNIAAEKFANMNKASKLMLKIGAVVFLVFLILALTLTVLFMANAVDLNGQTQLIEWIVLYSFRFWIVLCLGAFAMDIFKNR